MKETEHIGWKRIETFNERFSYFASAGEKSNTLAKWTITPRSGIQEVPFTKMFFFLFL